MNLKLTLLCFFGFVAIQRASELWISRQNARKLRLLGAKEFGKEHFPVVVLVHILYPLSVIAEIYFLGAHPGKSTPIWGSLFVFAQFLRYSAIISLGTYWNVRIMVVPG